MIFQYHAALLVCGSLRPRIFHVSTASGTQTVRSIESAPLLCHISCVCVCVCSLFFHPSHSSERYPVFPIFGVTKFEVRRTLPLAQPPQGFQPIWSVNRLGTEHPYFAFNSRLLPYKFGSILVFFLVGGSATSFLSGFCGLQAPVQLSTLQFSGYVRSMRARASDASRFHFSSII